jgi:hypothetical protein
VDVRSFFHLCFVVYVDRQERGRDEGYIGRNRVFSKRGQRMFNEDKAQPRIKWSCDEETFEKKEGEKIVTHTVDSYFRIIYDTPIRYPSMILRFGIRTSLL